jgi:hypothetical protein
METILKFILLLISILPKKLPSKEFSQPNKIPYNGIEN